MRPTNTSNCTAHVHDVSRCSLYPRPGRMRPQVLSKTFVFNSRPTDNVRLTASAFNAPAGFLSAGGLPRPPRRGAPLGAVPKPGGRSKQRPVVHRFQPPLRVPLVSVCAVARQVPRRVVTVAGGSDPVGAGADCPPNTERRLTSANPCRHFFANVGLSSMCKDMKGSLDRWQDGASVRPFRRCAITPV
jgi:hypothetical protein